MQPINHGQSNGKKDIPLSCSKFEVVIEDSDESAPVYTDHNSSTSCIFEVEEDDSKEHERIPSIASSETAMMDYVSIKGIKNRTGAAEHQLLSYVLKELIDNGLDFIDKNAGSISPELKVSVKKLSDRITIRVENSDFGLESFTTDLVKGIFNFNGFFSTKRNQYKVVRGALGDALKEVVCIPFAIADTNDITSWNEPLVIEAGRNIFLVNLSIDKVNQRITSNIEVKEYSNASTNNFTAIEISLPVIKNLDTDIRSLLENYSFLNTHVNFSFEVSLRGYNKGANIKLKLPACQKLTPSLNATSIYYCTTAEFKNLILSLDANATAAYQFLQLFKGGNNIKKDSVPETVGELKKKPTLTKPSEKTAIPFSTNKKEREQALTDRVEQLGYTVSGIRYGSRQYNHQTGEVQFPFIIEVAVISVQESSFNLRYVEGNNCSHRPYHTFLSGRPGTFMWRTKDGKEHSAGSIFELLEKYGYSFHSEKCKKPGTIFYINLISPRIDYQNYGKTFIDLKPFANALAETVYKTCVSKKDGGNGVSYFRDTAEGILTELLELRWKDVERDPTLIHTDRWTQSTVYYRLRPQLIAKGIDVSRKYITSRIKKICEETLGKTRAELGIVAADRAQLYFRHQWYDVGWDEIDKLMHMGTDMIIIEKEGGPEVMSPFADRMGIALLNTRGFLTEYATILSNLSRRSGCNVAILTDFDVSGLLLAKKIPGVHRIGIDFKTLDYFHLNPEDVEEPYNAENNHLKPLIDMGPADGESETTYKENLEYISNKRIEIDSILAKVGNRAFWQYLIDNLTQKFPKRNYNRSIIVPKFVMPDIITEFVNQIKNKITSKLGSEHDLIKKELSDREGTINDVDKEEAEIANRLKAVIANDKEIQPILTSIQKLKDEICT